MSEAEKGKHQANNWSLAAHSLVDTGLRFSFGPASGAKHNSIPEPHSLSLNTGLDVGLT